GRKQRGQRQKKNKTAPPYRNSSGSKRRGENEEKEYGNCCYDNERNGFNPQRIPRDTGRDGCRSTPGTRNIPAYFPPHGNRFPDHGDMAVAKRIWRIRRPPPEACHYQTWHST